MITIAIVLSSYFAGIKLSNTITGEIKKTKSKYLLALIIAIGLLFVGLYRAEFLVYSGVFFLWSGMIK